MTLEKDIKQTKPFRSPIEKTMVNIMYTHNWIHTKNHNVMKKFGLTVQQYNVLRILKGQNDKAITINGIIERMLDKMSNASRLVDKLVQKNYVNRTYREDDRRACNVSITAKGEKVLNEINLKVDDFQNLTNHLSDKEFETLNSLLDKFRNES